MSDRQRRMLAQKEATKFKRRMIEKVLINSKVSNNAFNLNFLVDGWLEIESDPGTFSLLLEDLGCNGAQVDEVYDLEQTFDSPVLGFIFLFKWLHHQPSERNRSLKSNASTSSDNLQDESRECFLEKPWSYVTNEEIISQIFFAKQTISNSCATHALISILLNCDYEKMNIGPILKRLKEHTSIMNPENKGYAIGNLPELAKAHNSHASYSSLYSRNINCNSGSGMSYMLSGNQRTNLQQQKNHEAYHFVSYVPINGRLYELDGLKNYPIDHGPIDAERGDWTEKFRQVIKRRIQENKSLSNEIRYNLMAVVPDKRTTLQTRLKRLRGNNRLLDDWIKRISSPISVEIPNPPYSPLSNATVTASEAGSICGSPHDITDHDDEVDKHFLIKFDSVKRKTVDDDNQEQAHKNCIIKLEETNIMPLDLTKSTNATIKQEESTKDSALMENILKKEDGDLSNVIQKTQNESDGTQKVSKNVTNPSITNPMIGRPAVVQTFQANAVHKVEDCSIINITKAHGNELYNLSTKPPFDFNILDDLQHVHSGKAMLRELQTLSDRLANEIKKTELALKEQLDNRLKYKIDNSRRTHNYEPFIMTFLSMLAKQGILADLIEKDLGIIAETPPTTTTTTTATTTSTTSMNVEPIALSRTPTKTTAITPIKRQGTGQPGRPPKIKPLPGPSETNMIVKPRPRYKYVSTGRPVGRPRKYPLPGQPETNNMEK